MERVIDEMTIDKMILLAREHSSVEIASILQVNVNTVRSTLGRFGVQIKGGRGSPIVNKEDILLMLELRKCGIPMSQVAKKFDISYHHCSRLTRSAYQEWKRTNH